MHPVGSRCVAGFGAVAWTSVPVTGKLFTLCATTSLPVKVVPQAKEPAIVSQVPPVNL